MSTGIIGGNMYAMGMVDVVFDPASVAANTSAAQTITVAGIDLNDTVFVTKPTLSAGLSIGGARVSAQDTISVTFVNSTASPIDAAAETYRVTWFRAESGGLSVPPSN